MVRPDRQHNKPNPTIITPLTLSSVPHKVADTVERVESHRSSKGDLSGSLDPVRQVVDELDGVGRVDNGVQRVESVCECSEVEDTSTCNTGDTVQSREVPSKLGLVNLKMGRLGTESTLSVENLLLVVGGQALGLDRAREAGDHARCKTACAESWGCLLAVSSWLWWSFEEVESGNPVAVGVRGAQSFETWWRGHAIFGLARSILTCADGAEE